MQKGHNHIVTQAPTGSGKTIVFSFMVKSAADKGKRCLILTHRTEILEQTGGTFDRLNIQFENITASTRAIPRSKILVAMIETIKRRALKRLDFQMLLRSVDLLILDEVHLGNFFEVFQYFTPSCYVIGFTATPVSTAKRPLSQNFTSLVTGPSIVSLIAENYLSKPRYFGVSVDLSKIKMKAGEFDERDQERLYSETKVFEGLRHNLDKHASGLKTMIFCPSVASSEKVASELGCAHVDGSMSAGTRDAILTTFETTPGAVLTNCGITTTGYDCPGIECIVLYRATTSLPLYLQMIGRGSRVAPGKSTFVILDFGMNVQRFGFWHIDRVWSLEPPKKAKKGKDVFPVKFCPQCGAVVSVNAKTCPECGYIWAVTEKERVFAELSELSFSQVQKRMSEAESVQEMEDIRVGKGYKVGYLLHKFKSEEQFYEYEKLRSYKNGWARIQIKNYLKNG